MHRSCYEAGLRARKSQVAISAASSGLLCRLMAMKLCIRSFIGPFSGFASASIGPGWTMLIVIPQGPKSRANPQAKPCKADLLTA